MSTGNPPGLLVKRRQVNPLHQLPPRLQPLLPPLQQPLHLQLLSSRRRRRKLYQVRTRSSMVSRICGTTSREPQTRGRHLATTISLLEAPQQPVRLSRETTSTATLANHMDPTLSKSVPSVATTSLLHSSTPNPRSSLSTFGTRVVPTKTTCLVPLEHQKIPL